MILRKDTVSNLLVRMYGSSLSDLSGLVHVTSVFEACRSKFHVIKINQISPPSVYDRLGLNATQLRADTILYSGGLLQENGLKPGIYPVDPLTLDPLVKWKETHSKRLKGSALMLTRGKIDLSQRFFHPSQHYDVYVCCPSQSVVEAIREAHKANFSVLEAPTLPQETQSKCYTNSHFCMIGICIFTFHPAPMCFCSRASCCLVPRTKSLILMRTPKIDFRVQNSSF